MLKRTFRKFVKRKYRFKKLKILGRVACLGQDILNLTFQDYGLNNHQKSRVDFLLDIHKYNQRNLLKYIYPYLYRKDIASIIESQEDNFFSYGKPDYIFIDSFSELTDQLFFDENRNAAFLANYSDVTHSISFKNKFTCKGLLDTKLLFEHYKNFFRKLTEVYGNTPIFFIFFPINFEKRESFKERADQIMSSVLLLKKSFSNLHTVFLDDDEVEKSTAKDDILKDFPYHYSQSTYLKFSKKVKSIIDKHNNEFN